jgi:hypothetical protein
MLRKLFGFKAVSLASDYHSDGAGTCEGDERELIGEEGTIV